MEYLPIQSILTEMAVIFPGNKYIVFPTIFWFDASDLASNSWFARFMLKLQQGSPQVLSLLADNPFPEKPPVYVRALLYRYFYTSPEQRRGSGNIWQRDYLGIYWPSNR